jgi:hypothetical protein
LKKAILIVAALMLVASGVAAVSAYEAHVINVKAHVENALEVGIQGEPTEINFGVMFPEEWNKIKRRIGLSTSAEDELGTEVGDLTRVEFKLFAEWKAIPQDPAPTPYPEPVVDIGNVDYYAWIGEWLWVAYPAATQNPGVPMADPSEWTNVGSAPAGMAKEIGDGTAVYQLPTAAGDYAEFLDVLFLAPCFEGYYNEHTDIKPDWWPTKWATPGPWPLILKGDARWIPAGVDLGCDLKVQVVNIVRVTGP